MNTINETLDLVVDTLERLGIDYALSGAFAMAHYGHPRATQDIDIQVRALSEGDLDSILDELPIRPRRIDHATWRFHERWDVELYTTRTPLEQESLEHRTRGRLFEDSSNEYWIVPLEALLVLKIREHHRYPQDLKHLDDARKLLARNHDTIDPTKLETLLALDPAWQDTWNEHIERV